MRRRSVRPILALALVAGLSLTRAQDAFQLGSDIDGEGARDFVGAVISLSDDGRRVATSAHTDGGVIDSIGHVRVYEYDGSDWRQLGEDVLRAVPQSNYTVGLDLSGDGRTLAVASPIVADDRGESRLRSGVGVYVFEDSAWRPRGEITREASDDFLAESLSLSADGTRLAVGSGLPDDNRGRVEVYEYDGAEWVGVGEPIEGRVAGETFGWEVELSADGRRLVVGAPDVWNELDDAGKVSVYEYADGEWLQRGGNLEGGAGDYLGSGVWISPAGTRVAAQATHLDERVGRVQIDSLEGGRWVPFGPPAPTEVGWLESTRMDLSAGAEVLAVSASNVTPPTHEGYVAVYQRSDGDWERLLEIPGERPGDQFARSLALSADGTRLAGGSSWNSDAAEDAGHVRVFALDLPVRVPEAPAPLLTLYPSPATDWLEVRLPTSPGSETDGASGVELAVYTADGRLAARYPLDRSTELDTSGLAAGSYLARVTGLDGGPQTIPFAVVR